MWGIDSDLSALDVRERYLHFEPSLDALSLRFDVISSTKILSPFTSARWTSESPSQSARCPLSRQGSEIRIWDSRERALGNPKPGNQPRAPVAPCAPPPPVTKYTPPPPKENNNGQAALRNDVNFACATGVTRL